MQPLSRTGILPVTSAAGMIACPSCGFRNNRQDAGPCILLSEVLVPENEPASGGLVLGHRARDGYFLRKGADLLLVVNKGTVW